MNLIRNSERDVVRAVAGLVDCNPFTPERIELERRALGRAFVAAPAPWSAAGGPADDARGDFAAVNPNAESLGRLVEDLGASLRQRLTAGAKASATDLSDYRDVVTYLLFLRYEDAWYDLIGQPAVKGRGKRVGAYAAFARDVAHFLGLLPGPPANAAHLFALGFQARRAFHYIFRYIFGSSRAAMDLRARIWRSIFTRNMRRYRSSVYTRLQAGGQGWEADCEL